MEKPDIGKVVYASVIQVKEDVPIWGGCLLIVDKVKSWGVQAYMRIPSQEGQTTFLRLKHEEYYYIGQAEVVKNEPEAENT